MKIKSYLYLFIPILLFGTFFMWKLIDQSQLIATFPLDYRNDVSSHMGKLFFLDKYGYNELIPNWYHGFYLFTTYPPGWYLMVLPLQKVLDNVQLVTYVSIVFLLLSSLLIILKFGKYIGLSVLERIFFFIVLFGNPVSVGNFLRLGRTPELTSWLIYLPLLFIIWIYKERRLDLKFFISSVILLSLLILAHPSATILTGFLLLSLFLIKSIKEKLILIFSFLLSLILTSFWWIPFLKNATVVSASSLTKLVEFRLDHVPDIVSSIIFPVAFLAIFYFYWNFHNKSRKELLFFSPILLLAILLITKIIVFLPFISTIQPDSFNVFFLSLTLLLFLKTPLNFFKLSKKYLTLIISIICIISIIAYIFIIPGFAKHTNEDNETIQLLNSVQNKFMIIDHPTSYSRAYYSYSAIYYNLSTPSGWDEIATTPEHRKNVNLFYNAVKEGKDCTLIKNLSKTINVQELITSKQVCSNLLNCNLTLKSNTTSLCLLTFNK